MKSTAFKILAFGVAAIFAALYTAEGFIYREYNLDMFQVATGYLKDRNASLYPTDFIWSKPDMIRNLHVCVRELMRATEVLSMGLIQEPIDLFLLWLPVCFLLFFLGNYLLVFRFTRDPWAGLLVACSFMLVRRTIWDWWGIGPTFTMSARGPVLSLLPLAFWAFLACEKHLLRLGGLFFLWGLVSNLHPLSGWGFVEFLGITILLVERFKPRAWVKVMIMGGATMLGSLPFLLVWQQVVAIPEGRQPSHLVIKQFLDYYHFIQPSTPKYLVEFLEDIAIPLGLAWGGFFAWRKSQPPQGNGSVRFLNYFPGVVLGMTLLVILVGSLLRQMGIIVPVMASEHSRNIKMLYLILPVWMGFAFAWWFRANNRSPWKWGAPVFVVLLSMVINFPGHKFARYMAYKAGWLPDSSVKKIEADMNDNAADLEVALWARNQTPDRALFYFNSYEFRYYSRRSLVFCSFDRACMGYHPTLEMEEWLRRNNRVIPLKERGDTQGMLSAAREFGADYLVVLKRWKPPKAKVVWTNSKYSVYQAREETVSP